MNGNLQIQIAGLQRLLKEVGDDPFLAPQITELLEDAELELAKHAHPGELFPIELHLARTAIFLSGESVIGNDGIKPQLAGEALIQYEKMFVAQAKLDERAAAREQGRQRRRKGTSHPSLLFVGTPRGSFGLEFTPRLTDELDASSRIDVHAKSLRNIASSVVGVVDSPSEKFDEAVKNVGRGILAPMKKFIAVLANHGAEVRFAFPDQNGALLSANKIKIASERLAKEVVEAKVKYTGTVRGVTLETFAFDFRLDEGRVISGTVSPDLGEDDLEAILKLTNNRCEAEFDTITVSPVGGPQSTEYILLSVPKSDPTLVALPAT